MACLSLMIGAAGALSRIHRVRGTVPVLPGCNAAGLLMHVMADLSRRGCPVRLAGGVLQVDGRSERRGSVLAFVDRGWIRVGFCGRARVMEYEFSTLGGLQLCAVLSLVAGGLAWFALGSAGLAVFGLLAPLLWLYGANRVLTAIRVPALLARLCASAPAGSGPLHARVC